MSTCVSIGIVLGLLCQYDIGNAPYGMAMKRHNFTGGLQSWLTRVTLSLKLAKKQAALEGM